MAALAYAIEGVIEAPPPEVFDFCSDLTNELVWNPNAEAVEKLTDGPTEAGTRFRARWATTGEVMVEVVEFDPPRTWTTRSAARGLEVLFRGTVFEQKGGTRYLTRMEIRPIGLAWIYAPLAWFAMRRQDTTNMRLIKQALESREETQG